MRPRLFFQHIPRSLFRNFPFGPTNQSLDQPYYKYTQLLYPYKLYSYSPHGKLSNTFYRGLVPHSLYHMRGPYVQQGVIFPQIYASIRALTFSESFLSQSPPKIFGSPLLLLYPL